MKLSTIYEALSKQQELDSVRLTYNPDHIDNTSSPHEYEERGISPTWRKKRDSFLNAHPEAKKMFQKGGEKREFHIRYENVLTSDPAQFNKTLFGEICKRASRIPNLMQVGIHKNTTMSPDQMAAALAVSMIANGVSVHTVLTDANQHLFIENYKKGLLLIGKAVEDHTKPDEMIVKPVLLSIGKILKMNPDLDNAGEDKILKAFENDSFRSNSKTTTFDIIVTGHPIDVYGMSTGRGWTSCANLEDKPIGDSKHFEPQNAAKYIGHDIHNHAHMVYLVKRGGDIDHSAVARVAFKLFHGPHGDTLMSENRVYGTAPQGFLQKANEIMADLFKIEEGFYIQHQDSYSDNDVVRMVGDNPKIDSTFLNKLRDRYTEDPDRLDDYVRLVTKLDQSKLNTVLDTIAEMCDLDKMDEVLELSNFGDVSSGLFYLFNFDEYVEEHVKDKFCAAILNNVPKRNLENWFFNSYEFKSTLQLVMQTILEEMSFSETHKCSCRDELEDVEREISHKKISSEGFINLTYAEMGEHPLRNITFIIDQFPNLAKLMDLTSIRRNISSRGDPLLKAFTSLVDDVTNLGDDVPTDVYKEFKSFGRLVEQIHKGRQEVKVGDGDTQAHDSTLDLMIRLESHHGAEHICDIQGFENVRAWVEQYLVDALPTIIDVDNEGHITLQSDNERHAHALIEFLKSQTTKKGTIISCLELIQTGQELVKMLDAST